MNVGTSYQTSSNQAVQQQVAVPKQIIKKKVNEISTPSIAQALAGKFVEEKKDEIKTPEKYAQVTKAIDKHFSIEQLLLLWPKFADKYIDQVHLYNTLSIKPDLQGNNIVKFNVENSVQLDQFRSLKPEILGFLRRGLENSIIDVHIELIKTNIESKVLTDDQKLKSMIQKNPAMLLFKNKFNLDFNS